MIKKLNELPPVWKQKIDKSLRIVAFGSSNTALGISNEGRHPWSVWLDIRVRDSIGNHACVINRGIGGETAEGLLKRIYRDVVSFTPEAVIITVGGNDIFQNHSYEKYTDNLKRICSIISENGALPILQTYYCPVYHLNQSPTFRDTFERFMDANKILADETSSGFIDQYSAFRTLYEAAPAEYAKLMRDWIHPGHLGNMIIAQNIIKAFGLVPLALPADMAKEVSALPELFKAAFY